MVQKPVTWHTTYITDADYFESYEKLSRDPRIEGVTQSSKGHLIFSFKGSDLWAELAPTGKMTIYWHNVKEKEKYYPLLTEVLAKADGTPPEIHALHANIYNITPPGPRKLSFAWCKQKISYIKDLGFWNYLKWRAEYNDRKHEREIRELDAKLKILQEKMFLREGEATIDELWEIENKWHKRYKLDQ